MGTGGGLPDLIAKPEPTRGPAADLWRKTLARIPTRFGRLAFLATLRDQPTGRYSHPPLAQMMGDEITDRTLRHSHHEIFSEWLGLSLAEQKADLDEYLSSTHSPLDNKPLYNSLEILPYRALVPASAHQVERQLYLTDLETLLELLRFERGGALAIPEA
jgi:hypothetical protein